MEAAWEQLRHFAQSDTQRVWIQQELLRYPPVAGQDPFAWLLWRSKIAEGMSEKDAWEWVVRSSSGGGDVVEDGAQVQAVAPADLEEDVQMVVAQSAPVNHYGFPHAEVAPPPHLNNPGYNATAPLISSGSTSILAGNSAAPDQSAEPRTVQMNDILPLPSASISYDDMEDATGSLDPSGSSGSSADGDGSEEEVDELEEEDIKPVIPDLSRPGPLSEVDSENKSDSAPFDLVPPQCSPHRLFTIQPSRFTVGPSRFRGEPYATYGTSPYAATPRALAHRVRPRKDSSSIDPPPPRPAVPRPSAQSRSPTKPSVAIQPPPPAKNEPVTMATIRSLITKERLRVDKPSALWKYLRRQADGAEPPRFEPTPAELREIAAAIWQAPFKYKQEMADGWRYAEQIGRWLKMMYKDPKTWEMAIPPLIILLSETDISMTVLVQLKYGKIVPLIGKRAAEENLPNSENINKACQKFRDQCERKLIPGNREIPIPVKKDEDAPKKRKIDEIASGSSASTAGAKTSTSTIVPERKTSLSMASDGKPKLSNANAVAGSSRPAMPSTNPGSVGSTSMSFFSPPPSAGPAVKRPKTLPPFKKRDPAAPTVAPLGSSVPPVPVPTPASMSSTSLLAATLARAKEAQAALTGAASANAAAAGSASLFSEAKSETKIKLNNKGHSVRFRDLVSDGGALYEERLFKEEPWELEPAPWGNAEDEEDVHGMSSHDMTLNEGMVFKKEHAEHPESAEIIDWYHPDLYNETLPPVTPECLAQEARERGILAAPGGTPDESTTRLIDPHPSKMLYLPEALVSADHRPVQQTVSQLLSNLTNLGTLSTLGVGGALGGIGGIGGIGPQVPAATNYYSQAPASYPNQQQGYPGNSYGYSAVPPPAQNQGWGQSSGYVNGYNQEPQSYGHPQPPQERRWGNAGGSSWGMAASGPPVNGGDVYGDRPSGGSGYNRKGGQGQGGRRGDGGYKMRPCKYFVKGACLDGDNCTFQH